MARITQTLTRQGALPVLMDEGIVSPVETAEFIALGMMDGIAMKVARCAGLWHASRIVSRLQENNLELFASGLSDPDLSLAASVHLFATAGLERPAALNAPQYIEGRGTTDPRFRAERDSIRVPAGHGLGIAIGAAAQRSLTMATQA
jgi:muconate cycloisomerase